MARSQELIDNVIQAYGEGVGIREIKKMYHISGATLYSILKEHASPELKEKHAEFADKKRRTDRKEFSVESAIQDLKNRMLVKDIAKKHGVSIDTLRKRFNDYATENNITLEEILSDTYKMRKVDIPIEDIVSDWKKGTTAIEIAQKHNVGINTIIDRIKEYEEKTGKKIERTRKKELPMESVIEDLKKGTTYKKVAEKYGVSVDSLRDRRVEYEKERGIKIDDILAEAGVITRQRKRITNNNKTQKIQVRTSVIWREYREGSSINNLALKYKTTPNVMKKRLHEYRARLMTKVYVDYNKSIAEIARDTRLPILKVKEDINKVLNEEVQVPVEWYLKQKCKGKTAEQIKKEYYILKKQEKQKEQKVNGENDEGER